MDSPLRRLRFAITTEDGRIPRWGRRCVRRILDDGTGRLAAVIEVGHSARSPVGKAWGAALAAVGLDGLVGHAAVLAGDVIEDEGHVFRLSSRCQDELARLDLDFILDFSLAPLSGPILNTTRLGVWWLRSDDRRPGRAPCARSVWWAEPTTALSLVRLAEDSSTVLFCGRTRTDKSLALTQDLAFRCAVDWAARCARLAQRGRPLCSNAPSSVTPIWAPSSAAPLGWPRRAMQRVLRRLSVLGRTYFTRNDWNIGVIERPIAALLDDPRPSIRWLPAAPRGSYRADPFGIATDSGLLLLAEEFRHRDGRGHLVAMTSTGTEGQFQSHRVPSFPCHVSYPYVFSDGADLYCVPETHEANEVVLYRVGVSPWRWERVATLLSGTPVVDATIFWHAGNWYMLGTTKQVDSETALHGWWAPSLLGPWKPHPANPLTSDVGGSRPAGTPFVHDGRLFRPAQDCSRRYGGSVVIHEVERLSPHEYRERPVQRVRPDRRGPYPHGLHTLAAVGDRTLVDGMRLRIRPQWRLIRRALAGRYSITVRPWFRRLALAVRRLPLIRPRVLR